MTTDLEREIRANLNEVTGRIAGAAARVNRDSQEITLVAVTKTWPSEVVAAAYMAGIRDVGENRPEELAAKRVEVQAMIPAASDLIWHQIGTVQSRKSNFVVEHAGYFHALDRLKIARRLSNQLQQSGRTLPVLLEVNISGEESKSGFLANNWENDATQQDSLRNAIRSIIQLPGLELEGLMTMAPWDVHEDLIRSVFRRARLLAQWLGNEFPDISMSQLSMGMSDDFEIAIEEGATIVRIGQAIFGRREQI